MWVRADGRDWGIAHSVCRTLSWLDVRDSHAGRRLDIRVVSHRLSWTKIEKPGCQSRPQTPDHSSRLCTAYSGVNRFVLSSWVRICCVGKPSGSNSATTAFAQTLRESPSVAIIKNVPHASGIGPVASIPPTTGVKWTILAARGAQSGFRNVAR